MMLELIMFAFSLSSAYGSYRRARRAEREGEPGTASFYLLITLLITLNAVVILLHHFKLLPPFSY